jgi:opacity protein-like surface antigen
VTANIASAISTAQTAFLLQSTAFVSAPGNPGPNQQGSGVWTRAVGGVADIKNNVNQAVTATSLNPGANGTGAISCTDNKFHSTFAGVQFGHDISRLNVDGWNINFGTTAGVIESHTDQNTPQAFNTLAGNVAALNGVSGSRVTSPFVGTYLTVSKGGFFADALLRFEHYEAQFSIPAAGVRAQNLNARGVTVAASAGYHYVIPGTKHFFEPSLGIVASRTKVDAFNMGGGAIAVLPGILQVRDIDSVIGRAGFRVGTTWEAGQWVAQPFFAASIWHDFAKAPTASYDSHDTFFNADPAKLSSAMTGQNIGTYGQFSVGASGQLVGTGIVAFGRFDYRVGNRLESWDGTAGFRYHFTPEPTVALVGKSPVYKAAPAVVAHNWTGAYLGVSAGALFARDRMDVGGVASPDPRGSGALGGLQIGYNWQFNPSWVGGLELAADLTNLQGAKECSAIPNVAFSDPLFLTRPPLYNTTCNFESNWLIAMTGRLGYVWGRALWYVRAGGAWTRETINLTCNADVANGAVPCTGLVTDVDLVSIGNVTRDRFGFTGGYGVEFALTPKWTARAETSYYNFGNRSAVLSNGFPVNSKYEMISTKIGVNYKLSDR